MGTHDTPPSGGSHVRSLTLSHTFVVGDGEDARLHCDHCGEEVPMPYGVVTWVCGVIDAFNAAHCRCHPGDEPFGRTRFAGERNPDA